MCLIRGGGLQHDLKNSLNISYLRNIRSEFDDGIRYPIRQHGMAVRHRNNAAQFQTFQTLVRLARWIIFCCLFYSFQYVFQFRFAQTKYLRSHYDRL